MKLHLSNYGQNPAAVPVSHEPVVFVPPKQSHPWRAWREKPGKKDKIRQNEYRHSGPGRVD